MGKIRELAAKHREAISYVFWGGFTTLISWGTYALFVVLGISPDISNILSWFCGVTFAFVTNKLYVFMSKSWESKLVVKELSMFIGSRILTGVLSWVIFPILVYIGLSQSFLGIENMWARIITSIIEIALNWIFSKYLVFRKEKSNA